MQFCKFVFHRFIGGGGLESFFEIDNGASAFVNYAHHFVIVCSVDHRKHGLLKFFDHLHGHISSVAVCVSLSEHESIFFCAYKR